MNPYLEARWGDVHTSLCTLVRAALQPSLPAGLRARAEESVVLEFPNGRIAERFRSDAVIIEPREIAEPVARGAAVASVAPLVVRHGPKTHRNRWVEIIDTTAGNHVVSVIEILSPGNKSAGPLNRLYRRKLRRYIEGGVNIVEIDLLRSSRKRLEVKAEELPPDRRAPYMVCVYRAGHGPDDEDEWEVYPIPLREPLPTVPVPCRESDPDVPLALQPLIDRTYVEGGHDDIDYRKPLRPRLSPEEQAWVASLVSSPTAA